MILKKKKEPLKEKHVKISVGIRRMEAVGKAFQRITVYICTTEDVLTNPQQANSSEVIVTSRSAAEFNVADTVVFDPS
ncbi:hypothetical protein DPEC_G00179010 [Dallia pectoralis]|uniref:Uncharacterized protein n=1 Tax=Dallia pectoralis TaxID=75939 RepID=A0ACC2GF34_DALPE|nr:hypothetical protein DPEC_G00179010 [Dallia pectoralis]